MIGIAAVVGAVSIFAADLWIKSQARNEVITAAIPVAAKPRVEFKHIVVAKKPLHFGDRLSRAELTEIPWPEKDLPKGASASIDKLLAGGPRVVLRPIAANEPVLMAKLSGPGGRASLSNLLTPGMRAVTIKTDEIAGVGGFITPGDRVDVVLTRNAGDIAEVQGNARGASGATIATEVVVQNAKVLSVGQGADPASTAPRVAHSVTLEVSAEAAQKIALARNVGTLSLTLRPATDAARDAAGITTISSFAGSAAAGASGAAASIFNVDDEPKYATVIVTRGMNEKSYKVIAADK